MAASASVATSPLDARLQKKSIAQSLFRLRPTAGEAIETLSDYRVALEGHDFIYIHAGNIRDYKSLLKGCATISGPIISYPSETGPSLRDAYKPIIILDLNKISSADLPELNSFLDQLIKDNSGQLLPIFSSDIGKWDQIGDESFRRIAVLSSLCRIAIDSTAGDSITTRAASGNLGAPAAAVGTPDPEASAQLDSALLDSDEHISIPYYSSNTHLFAGELSMQTNGDIQIKSLLQAILNKIVVDGLQGNITLDLIEVPYEIRNQLIAIVHTLNRLGRYPKEFKYRSEDIYFRLPPGTQLKLNFVSAAEDKSLARNIPPSF
ncbi:MAG TPA: hypothetical protein EYO58_01900, partial [Flavobacteriales bacterium]|nr:hypothetical protein [Flavobacteriales bacterium]